VKVKFFLFLAIIFLLSLKPLIAPAYDILNHGELVAQFARETSAGPDHGEIVSEIARNKFKSGENFALSFDGLDDFVVINHSPTLVFGKEITLEAWVFPKSPFFTKLTLTNKYMVMFGF